MIAVSVLFLFHSFIALYLCPHHKVCVGFTIAVGWPMGDLEERKSFSCSF